MGFAIPEQMGILQELGLVGDVLRFTQLGTRLLTSPDKLELDVEQDDSQPVIVPLTSHVQSLASKTISQCRSFESKFQRGFAGSETSTTCPELHDISRQCYSTARLLKKYLERTHMRENRLRRGRVGLKAALVKVWSKKGMNEQARDIARVEEYVENVIFNSIRGKVTPTTMEESPGFFLLEADQRELIMALAAGLVSERDLTIASTQVRALCLIISRSETPSPPERRPSVFSIASNVSSSSYISSVSQFSSSTCLSMYSDNTSHASLNSLFCDSTITPHRESSRRDGASDLVLRDLAVIPSTSRDRSFNDGMSRPYDETCREILEDPMNSFRLWLRDPEDHHVYWINGPPGSGKSTLLESIHDQLRRDWPIGLGSPGIISETKLIVAKFSATPAGANLRQKSQVEFYQGILHEILRQDRRLVPLVFSRAWSAAYCNSVTAPTELKENYTILSIEQLKAAVNWLFTQDIVPFRACLLIDDLEDYGGADSDLVGKLMCEITEARWTNAKCCVSTPPSSALSAVFEGQPSLQMPELTGPAMRKFALDQLASHEAFREMRGLDSRLLHQCVHDIVGAANGVFPWTELTIATAMDKHEKGDGMRELRTRIRRLPRALGELYEYTSRPEYDAPVLAATD
ncbi:hypothetical protein PG999_009886 [Apiospora kogelbergensis]|uniref:Nephrocystin 3-like N-terminal domain-containing protein n=1 Tax=Apiospora kogelbergensis TaxID=1337665 RepID=A0AAW0QKE9_9PEZI